MAERFTRFDAAEFLKTPEEMAAYRTPASKRMLATMC
jgi:hypothetical protein